MKRNCVYLFVFIVMMFDGAYGQKRGPDADTVIAKVVKGFAGVRDFIVTVDAEINMERVQVPKMHATMYFKTPDKIHFSSTGFLLVPRDGVALNPAVLAERYDASFIGTETVEGRKLYKLQLAAKDKRTKLRQMYSWIDPLHWTIAKIETIPYEGRTLSVVFVYDLVSAKFWLPSKLVVSFGSTGEGEKTVEDTLSNTAGQFSQMQRSVSRNGSVTILYSEYKLNTGLDDSVFNNK